MAPGYHKPFLPFFWTKAAWEDPLKKHRAASEVNTGPFTAGLPGLPRCQAQFVPFLPHALQHEDSYLTQAMWDPYKPRRTAWRTQAARATQKKPLQETQALASGKCCRRSAVPMAGTGILRHREMSQEVCPVEDPIQIPYNKDKFLESLRHRGVWDWDNFFQLISLLFLTPRETDAESKSVMQWACGRVGNTTQIPWLPTSGFNH